MSERRDALVVLFGGPAGAGKSTLAAAWCATRERAAHIQLDIVREMIVSGRADPQEPGTLQSEQYELSVRACCDLARSYAAAGFDVAVDDVLPPQAFEALWRPALDGLDWRVVVVTPRLDETLTRARSRGKRVAEAIIREQHEASLRWPDHIRVDTTGLGITESLALVETALEAGAARTHEGGGE